MRGGAAAPASGRQVPGFYRLKVGSVEVTVVSDGLVSVTNSFEVVVSEANAAPVFAAVMGGALRMLGTPPDAPSDNVLLPPDSSLILEDS